LLLYGLTGGRQNLHMRKVEAAAGFRYPVSVEEILDVEPGKRLAYTVLRGIPVRNYRAEVTLTPSPDGTLIRWGASWDRTIMGRLVYRSLRNLYPVIVAGLVKAAEAPQS
jgi:uncharacterized protein YndB with AHSA1/START domain